MITDEMLTEVIDSVGIEFDSHEIIQKVTQRNQRDYILQLYAHRERGAPIHHVHSQLGRGITKICMSRNYTRADERNADIFGQNSKCIRWKKSA